MSIEIKGTAGVLAPQFTGGDQKPPIKNEEQKTQPESPSTIVELGQVQEESPVYSPNYTGGDQKPPIKTD